ncbi:MAG: glycosyltransferase [Methanoregulaceae archaeon]|nr:glycosyltransferase [Methanoregulaceae archaeon]
MHCSVVIRAYNEEKHIGRLLEGISQQTIQEVEVVLVDSGSTDATATIAAQHGVNVIHILPEEFTFGRSLNLGISATTQPWVVIASAHVYPVYPDWLERLLEPLSDTKVALVYGKQRGAEATLFSEHQILAQWYTDRSQPRQAHPFCNNANVAIQRSLWEEHSYDETLTGLEDLAWAQWAMRQGYGIAYIAEAEVVHVHHETPRGVYNRYRREAMAFKHLYPHERFHCWDFVRLSTTNIASDLWHATQQGALRDNWASIFWFRIMQFWGTYQGYRHPGPLTWKLRQTFYYPRGIRATSQIAPRNVEPIQYNE